MNCFFLNLNSLLTKLEKKNLIIKFFFWWRHSRALICIRAPAVSRAPLMGSCRLTLALMCLAGTLAFFLMRLNLSFALVCMVSSPSAPAAVDDDDAHDAMTSPMTSPMTSSTPDWLDQQLSPSAVGLKIYF